MVSRACSQKVQCLIYIGIFATSSEIESVTKEIIKMSKFDHPNVMELIGVCLAPSDEGNISLGPSIIMPFMARGNLLNYLREEADKLFTISEEEVIRLG